MTKGGTKKLGVIGHPIGHSLSPRIHNFWLKQHGIDITYEATAVEPRNLETFLAAMPERNYIGLNLTIPHKEAALKMLSGFDADVAIIGAVNTIIVKEEKLHGRNTDAYGFMGNLKQVQSHFLGHKTLVLGAGGAARAVCAGLLDAGCSVMLANRTRGKADMLAQTFREIKVIDWEELEKALPSASLLVNTTSLGMKGQPELSISLAKLPKDAVVTDIVYNPLITPLLAEAKERGNPTIDGLGMLLYQAQMAFYHWFGILPEVNETLRNHVLEGLK